MEQLRAADAAAEEAKEAPNEEALTEEVEEAPTEEAGATAGEEPVSEAPSYTYIPKAEPAAPEGSPVMIGFGKALTSAILSFVAYILSLVSTGVAAEDGSIGVLIFLALPATVVALILGISSIKTFKASIYSPKPIPALILGISGVVLSGIAALLDFASLMIAITV